MQIEVTDPVWEWLTDWNAPGRGIWVFAKYDPAVLNQLKQRLESIKDISLLTDTSLTLIKKTSSVKYNPFFSKEMIEAFESSIRTILASRIKGGHLSESLYHYK